MPGNHDVPLYDVLRRFLSPLTRYRRFIDDTLCPFIELPGVAVLGINTARSLTFKDGRISEEQVEFIRETFARTDPEVTRVLVTHHPAVRASGRRGGRAARSAGRSWRSTRSNEAGVDLLLAGHAHHASAHDASDLVARRAERSWSRPGPRPPPACASRSRASTPSTSHEDGVTITVNAWNGEQLRARRRPALPHGRPAAGASLRWRKPAH